VFFFFFLTAAGPVVASRTVWTRARAGNTTVRIVGPFWVPSPIKLYR